MVQTQETCQPQTSLDSGATAPCQWGRRDHTRCFQPSKLDAWGAGISRGGSGPQGPPSPLSVTGCVTQSSCHHTRNTTVALAGSDVPRPCAAGWDGGGAGGSGRRRWKQASRHLGPTLLGSGSCPHVLLGVPGPGGVCPLARSERVTVTLRTARRWPEARPPWCCHEPDVCGLWMLLYFWLEELSERDGWQCWTNPQHSLQLLQDAATASLPLGEIIKQ